MSAKSSILILAFSLGGMLVGCGSGKKDDMVGAESIQLAPEGVRVNAEAFLFDARVRRDGKPTTFRLEILKTDSFMVLGGRGYLGKGALRGYMTKDSLVAYFPSTGEFVRESLQKLLSTDECELSGALPDMAVLFNTRVDSAGLQAPLAVTRSDSDEERPQFLISAQGCRWQMQLTYDRQEDNWRVRNLEFDNGLGTTLTATRREYKAEVKVPEHKLVVTIPADAVLLEP